MITVEELFPELSISNEKVGSYPIANLYHDSRQVKPHAVFINFSSSSQSQFIEQAVFLGAQIIITSGEKLDFEIKQSILYIYHPDIDAYTLTLTRRFYHAYLNEITFIAVTGTNGKTSIAYLLSQALSAYYVGTLGIGPIDDLSEGNHTTPHYLTLLNNLKERQGKLPRLIIIEASSHALAQNRLAPFKIETAIFTNLTHDHLDYHGSMEAYAQAKFLLFQRPELKRAIINFDDTWGRQLIARLKHSKVNVLSYSLKESQADIYNLHYSLLSNGLDLRLASPWGEIKAKSSLLGEFNLSNLLAVVAVLGFKYPPNKLDTIIKKLKSVPGRMQLVRDEPIAIVDYAHTPDALSKALAAVRALSKKAVWCVFGCGGERDKEKRAKMGQIASHQADNIVLTNDNPRREEPSRIIQDILAGVEIKQCQLLSIEDRQQAIHYALDNASKDDIVLIAGKGHENYQVIGDETQYFLDEAVVLAWKRK